MPHIGPRPDTFNMADFTVSYPSEPNQIFYYIILQFLPPISFTDPGALLVMSVEEMFPLLPSVVIGGHIGNQSRNKRRVQRAGPLGSGQAPLWPGITAL